MNTKPVAPRLFATSPALRLLAGRHRDSGRLVFPLPPDRDSYATVELPERGTLWSYTVQRFAPKSPPYRGAEPFSPFALGYIDLPGALIVESRLTDVEFDHLRVGQAMELTTMPLRVEPDGTVITIYAFRPAQGQRS